MRNELDTAYERAAAMIGIVGNRALGRVGADETIAFSRACSEDNPP